MEEKYLKNDKYIFKTKYYINKHKIIYVYIALSEQGNYLIYSSGNVGIILPKLTLPVKYTYTERLLIKYIYYIIFIPYFILIML